MPTGPVSPTAATGPAAPVMTAVGAFAGIGGVEAGLAAAGIAAGVLVESWGPARAVLAARMPAAELLGDIREVASLPRADVLAGGFPCTDLSQAGATAGIDGAASGLVREVFRLLADVDPTWLVLENVRNMLVLHGGRAMDVLAGELEARGYRWAYRLVDSRAFGVPQRRQRVLLVASRTADPRGVLFADDAAEPAAEGYRADAFGFYWTEGLRGLGWARDAVPTLKGGSTVGIPSPPGVWLPGAAAGRALVVPTVEDGEALQGFPRGWTEPAAGGARRAAGVRWKLVGNAVTVPAAAWLGSRLVAPGAPLDDPAPLAGRWPTSAWGGASGRWDARLGLWPVRAPYSHLTDVLTADGAPAVSARGAAGFYSRMLRSTLRFDPAFARAVAAHVAFMQGAAQEPARAAS